MYLEGRISMSDTAKIGLACFIGSVLCCAVAFALAPVYWWLGLIAGFAGGYISYDFRDVLRAIPIAATRAWQGTRDIPGDVAHDVKVWFLKPHPFLLMGTTLSVLVMTPLVVLAPPTKDSGEINWCPGNIVAAIFLFVLATLVFGVVTLIMAMVQADGERRYFISCGKDRNADLEREGHQPFMLTYRNGIALTLTRAMWMARATTRFICWKLWVSIASGIWKSICFLLHFAWNMFKLIHSRKRLLCGVDGMLGGAVTYVWFTPPTASPMEQLMLVVFSGILGAIFGIANWEIVSKRILHVGSPTAEAT